MNDRINGWTSVTVGVADLDVAERLWVDEFGMSIVARRNGSDQELARLWRIDAADVSRQLLVRTNDEALGMVHFVEFKEPAAPVRLHAQAFDYCPKNLDLYVENMPERISLLKAAGQTFRNEEMSEIVAPDGTAFREIHMPTHDGINVVLIEILGKQQPMTTARFGAVGPLIFTVPDAAAEKAFVAEVLELDKLSDNLLNGPEIEKMIGLPQGAGLDVSIWGRHRHPLGQLEIIEYQQVEGASLYARAKPKSTGILHVNFVVDDFSGVWKRLQDRNIDVTEHGVVDTLLGRHAVYSFHTPAGLKLEVHERLP